MKWWTQTPPKPLSAALEDTVYRHVSVLAFAAAFHLQQCRRVQGTEADVDNPGRAGLRQLPSPCSPSGTSQEENHGLFYSTMRIESDGIYSRIEVGKGIFWFVTYAIILFIIIYIVVNLILALANHQQNTAAPYRAYSGRYLGDGSGACHEVVRSVRQL